MSPEQIRRILIVEDERSLLHLLARSFLRTPEDYEVVTVGSGEEAIEEMTERPFGVIITDLVLPGMTGLDLLERSRMMHPEVSVIVITGFGDDEVRDRTLALGALDYIEKPFPFERIRQAVLRGFETRTILLQNQGGGGATQR